MRRFRDGQDAWPRITAGVLRSVKTGVCPDRMMLLSELNKQFDLVLLDGQSGMPPPIATHSPHVAEAHFCCPTRSVVDLPESKGSCRQFVRQTGRLDGLG